MKKICDVCNSDLVLLYEDDVRIIDGIRIKYKYKKLFCKKCNKEIYDKDVFTENIIKANDELRKQTGLIRTEEIIDITNKYKIGNKSLSLVLGFGEIQIDRYLKSGNPSKEHSDILKSVYKNPFMYEMYLLDNKDKISENVFKKSLSATKQIELIDDNSKLYNTVEYIISKTEDITNMSIQKILYFINGFSKKFLGYKLFEDNCEAWVHGPVYRDLYDALCVFYRNIIDYKEIIQTNDFNLTDEEKKYIDGLLPFFENYSGSALRNMTHLTDPWIKSRIGLSDDEPSERIIDDKDIDNYFNKIEKEYNIKTIEDVGIYIKDLFEKSIRKANN